VTITISTPFHSNVGIDRFEQIQADLGISRKVLTERLKWLVESGVLEHRQYETRPPRYEYVLTAKGTELCDLLLVMVRWGDRWADDGGGPQGLPGRGLLRPFGGRCRCRS
jgi:DNA-binding HxlR family transcriptional regulator